MERKRICIGLQLAVVLLGIIIGGSLATLGAASYEACTSRNIVNSGWFYTIAVILSAFLSWMVSSRLLYGIFNWISTMEKALRVWPVKQLIAAVLGLIAGLVVAMLVSQMFRFILPQTVWKAGAFIIDLVLGFLGALLGGRRWQEIFRFSEKTGENEEKTVYTANAADRNEAAAAVQNPKGILLDTSILIDGRILDVCRTGFLRDPILIPQFVLQELQHIADHVEASRRTRGRRGLDVVEQIRKEQIVPVEILQVDFAELQDVDSKLLKLSRETGCTIMTNDYNLTKVAGLADLKTINLNQLASALKMAILSGEELQVQILKEGREVGQGIGYMSDGTMIVVDGGRGHVGETVTVTVTTALQTNAGRMIFTRIKSDV